MMKKKDSLLQEIEKKATKSKKKDSKKQLLCLFLEHELTIFACREIDRTVDAAASAAQPPQELHGLCITLRANTLCDNMFHAVIQSNSLRVFSIVLIFFVCFSFGLPSTLAMFIEVEDEVKKGCIHHSVRQFASPFAGRVICAWSNIGRVKKSNGSTAVRIARKR